MAASRRRLPDRVRLPVFPPHLSTLQRASLKDSDVDMERPVIDPAPVPPSPHDDTPVRTTVTDQDVVLSTTGLSRSFGRVQAVRGVDIQVRRGDVYGFLGLNGAGKTTTIRMLLGLLRPTAGRISFFGEEIRGRRSAWRRGIGALVEGPAFFGRLTGYENVLLLGRVSGGCSPARASELLELVGLSQAAHRQARTFSLGMKQRLGIALALVGKPRMVILDEPTNGLDPQGIRDVRDLLLRLNAEEGLTLLVSSHLLSEVEQLCTRVGILHEGRLIMQGGVEEIMSRASGEIRLRAEPEEQARRVIAGMKNRLKDGGRLEFRDPPARERGWIILRDGGRLDTAELVRTLVAAGVEVSEITRRRPTLEEIFLRQVQPEEQVR